MIINSYVKGALYMENRNGSVREKSIVFIGFMGVGKTTVAQLVAKKLYRSFVDIDQEIEKEFQLPTTEIFDKVGETAFREKEKDYSIYYCKQKLNVVSLGGGAFMQQEIREACLKNSIVFHLDISWDSWKKRLPFLIDSRPVLQNRSISEIKDLFYERKNYYSSYNSRLLTDNYNQEEIAEQVIDSLKLAWELYDD